MPETGTNGTRRCRGSDSSLCLRAKMSAPQTTMAILASSDGWMRKNDVPNCTQLVLPFLVKPSGVKVSSCSPTAAMTSAQPRIFRCCGERRARIAAATPPSARNTTWRFTK